MSKFIKKIDEISKREPQVSVADQECAEVAHVRRGKIIELKKEVMKHFLLLGKELYDMEQSQDWFYLGFASMRAYCDAPVESGGLNESQGWLIKLKEIYRVFIHNIDSPENQLLEIGPEKLYMLKSTVEKEKDPVKVKKWLKDASKLGKRDLKKEIEDNGCSLSKVPDFVDVIRSMVSNTIDCFKRTYNYKEPNELDVEGGCKRCVKIKYCRMMAEAMNEYVKDYRKQKEKKKAAE